MRIGIIGCGLIGTKRASAAGGHEIVLVADLDCARAEKLAGQTGAKATRRWQDVAGAELDIVIVATSHDQLAPIALAAIENGKHVLVEKPAGRHLDEVIRLARTSKEKGRFVKVGFNHRFHPAILKAKEIVDSGELGPLMFLRARYGHGGRVGYEKEWRCQKKISGGGELIDQGAHLIDLSRWFLGELEIAYSHNPTFFWKTEVEDNSFLALKSPTGQIAWLHASWSEWKNIFSFEIYGRDGKLAIDGLGGSYGLERLTHFRMLPEMGPPETKTWEFPSPDKSWEVEFAEFDNALDSNREPLGNIHDAVALHRLISKSYGRKS